MLLEAHVMALPVAMVMAMAAAAVAAMAMWSSMPQGCLLKGLLAVLADFLPSHRSACPSGRAS